MSTIIYKNYPNGCVREINVVSVDASDDPKTLVLNTVSEGAIVLSQSDDPVLWQQVIDAGLVSA